jgi:hypothetical protein
MTKSRGASAGTYGIVSDDDQVASFLFTAADGTDLSSTAARWDVEIDGTPGVNDMPGRIVFRTTADGAATPTERMRISSGGQVNIGDNMVVYSNPNLQIRSQDNTAIGAADLWSALNKPGIDVRNSSNTQFSYAGINFFGGTSSNSYAGINMVQTTANSKGALTFWTGGNGEGAPYAYERMRIDSAGRVLIGHTSSINMATDQAAVQVVGTGSNDANSTIARFSGSAYGPYRMFVKSRATSKGGSSVVYNNDYLGRVAFYGDDGTDQGAEGANIQARVDGSPSGDDMPGRLEFYTTSDGADTASERMRITNTGLVSVGTQSNFGTATGTVVQTGSSGSLANALIMAHKDVTAGSGNTGEAFCELQLKLGIQGKLRFHAEVDVWFYINTGPDRGSAKYIFSGYFNGGSSALDRYTVYNTDPDNIGIPVAYTSGSQKGIKVQFTNTNASNGLFGQMKVNVTWNP